MMIKKTSYDVVIFGGGIAGLWTFNRLKQLGLSVILLERETLGGGQTHKSQGIIHGGLKYALQGALTKDAKAMLDMPSRWLNCLQGKGEIDLSNVPILSSHQYLWSPNKFTANLTGFLVSKTLQSKVQKVEKNGYPSCFQSPQFKGELFALNEMVIDVPVLIRELVKGNEEDIFKIDKLSNEDFIFNESQQLTSVRLKNENETIELHAQQFIFTAGSGNEIFLKPLEIAMQLRPLHMVLMKLYEPHFLYAHCLGLGNRPRLTITSHQNLNGDCIWYLGGNLAEEGVMRDSKTQIEIAKRELKKLFPWIDFTQAKWATFMINRAEPKQKNALKPETFFIKKQQNYLLAWPTKLAFAPQLADEIIKNIQPISPKFHEKNFINFTKPKLANPIWEDLF